jgi:site-specific DNA recombinase
MTRAAIYARYSSDRQNENSVGDQIVTCSRYAEARGWEITRTFSDAAISGSAMANRPGLLDAVAAAERGEYDVLLAEDEDRFARNLEQQAHVFNRIVDAGAQLWSISTGRIELMHVAMKGFMAEAYIQNLSAKTKRGMRANAEAGKATGSRLYGYRTAPGGAQEIVDEEAAVIRRIFADYAAGDTPRQIATALNAEGVPGPRGGAWNQSSINGSRQRGNGVLNTELYVGVKVWGRMDVRKDRNTGKRLPKMLPPDQWKRVDVPQLRIVADETWRAAKARQAPLQARPEASRRRPGVFSGLLKCGACGGSYTVYTGGKLICATYREKGTCTNRRTPNRLQVEQRVLDGLRERILGPEAVASYVRAYRAAAKARRRAQADRRAPLEKRLGEVSRGIERVIDAIVDGSATGPMKARMKALDEERIALEAELAAGTVEETAEPVELHPGAATAYAAMVAELQATLAEFSAGQTRAQRDLVDAVRGLVEKIVIHPETQDRGGPIRIVLHGTLARFMEGEEHEANARSLALVAGGGIEPPTCGL